MHRMVFTNTATLNGGDTAIVESMRLILQKHGLLDTLVAMQDNAPTASARYMPGVNFTPLPFPMRRVFQNRWLNAIHQRGLLMRHQLVYTFGAAALPFAGKAFRTAWKDYAQSEATVSAGGTYLIEKYTYIHRLLTLGLAQKAGCKTILFTQSLGPFTSKSGRFWARKILSKADLILLREEKSLNHLKEIGVNISNCRILPDSVFAMAEPQDLTTAAGKDIPETGLKLAISVRDCAHFHPQKHAGHKQYEESIAHLVKHLVKDRNAMVEFISTCQGIPDYVTDDSKTAASIAALAKQGLPENLHASVTVDAAYHHPVALKEHLKRFHLVISTRMHGAILALTAGVPVLPIAYEFKTSELYKDLNAYPWLQELNDISPQTLMEKFSTLTSQYPAQRSGFWHKVEEHRTGAMQAGEEIRKVLEA